MKVTIRINMPTSDPFKVRESRETFHAINYFDVQGTSVRYFRTDRFNIRCINKADIISIEQKGGIEMKRIDCNDKRECFARDSGKCTVLKSGYEPGKCPFCKPKRDETDGVKYQYKKRY